MLYRLCIQSTNKPRVCEDRCRKCRNKPPWWAPRHPWAWESAPFAESTSSSARQSSGTPWLDVCTICIYIYTASSVSRLQMKSQPFTSGTFIKTSRALVRFSLQVRGALVPRASVESWHYTRRDLGTSVCKLSCIAERVKSASIYICSRGHRQRCEFIIPLELILCIIAVYASDKLFITLRL